MAKQRNVIRDLIETAVLTIAIFLVVRVALQNFKVEGMSMEPNLHNGEYILVNKVDYLLHSPQRGDVIVFRAVPAGQPDRDFIKRVIGLPGEYVSVHDNTVFINGKPLHENYLRRSMTYVFPSTKIPKNDYFVLGDNRDNSEDSHLWKWLPKDDIIGKAWVAYWPPSDIHLFAATTSLGGLLGGL
jgi:signal peptidase I